MKFVSLRANHKKPAPSSAAWSILAVVALAASTHAACEISFDRPGLAFATTLLPSGVFVWEQSLPDYSRVKEQSTRISAMGLGSNFRYGLNDKLELQIATSLWNRVRVSTPNFRASEQGRGDTRLALKAALPSARVGFQWAALVGVGFPTGDDAFTNDDEQLDLGLSLTQDVGSGTWGLYGNWSHVQGNNAFVLSPNFGFALTETVQGYVEAGVFSGSDFDQHAESVGAGLTWMARDNVQLDFSASRGSKFLPDWSAGFGVSVHFE